MLIFEFIKSYAYRDISFVEGSGCQKEEWIPQCRAMTRCLPSLTKAGLLRDCLRQVAKNPCRAGHCYIYCLLNVYFYFTFVSKLLSHSISKGTLFFLRFRKLLIKILIKFQKQCARVQWGLKHGVGESQLFAHTSGKS